MASPGLLQPFSVPKSIFSDIIMDFIEGLPNSNGKSTIVVVVDRLSKYAHFLLLPHPFTTAMVAHHFLDHVYKLHGLLETIVSDKDPIFISKFWQEMFKLQGVELRHSSSYHPQIKDDKMKNGYLETYLRRMTGNLPRSWSKWISLAKFWYNTTYHTTIKMTPFQAHYGIPPSVHIPYFHKDSSVQAMDLIL